MLLIYRLMCIQGNILAAAVRSRLFLDKFGALARITSAMNIERLALLRGTS
jgi:hypothetical protein